MSVLDDIAYFQKKQAEEMGEVKRALYRMESPLPDPEPFPELFINSSEVQRILKVSSTTVTSWTKCGLLTKRKNEKCPSNCYSTSEILWIEKQKYSHLSPGGLRRLVEKRKDELGF
jgi:hypothetical protein